MYNVYIVCVFVRNPNEKCIILYIIVCYDVCSPRSTVFIIIQGFVFCSKMNTLIKKNSNAFFIAFNFLHSLQTRQYTRDPQNWDECYAGPELLPLAMSVRLIRSYSIVHLFFSFLIWQQSTHKCRIHGEYIIYVVLRDYNNASTSWTINRRRFSRIL